MNTQTFYETIGGNYNEIIGRFLTEERVLRFVRKFPADGSYAALKQAIANGATEEAFRAAHTLKGVAQNLSLTSLYLPASKMTEILRGGSLDVMDLMPELDKAYNLVIENIALLD